MNAEEILNLLVDEFGSEKITGSNLEAIDPWVEVSAAAIERESGEKRTCLGASGVGSDLSRSFVSASQILTRLSSAAVAMNFPSGETSTETTCSACPKRVLFRRRKCIIIFINISER